MKTLTSKTSKMATRSWYFLSFSDLLWQINTVEVETKACQDFSKVIFGDIIYYFKFLDLKKKIFEDRFKLSR